MTPGFTRREFLAGGAAAFFGVLVQPGCRKPVAQGSDSLQAVAITQGPRHHWFGYYDKLQFDPTGRFVLGAEVDFEDRHPGPDDPIGVGMIDRTDNNRWIPLSTSRAWSWQQGCMLQWMPGSRDEILFNDREQDRFVSRILNVRTRAIRTVPFPVFAIAPDGATAVTTDFARIGMIRYGYGYPVREGDKQNPVFERPEKTGIWHIDLQTGQGRLILSLAKLQSWPRTRPVAPGAVHWTNHLLVSPNGSRIVFLHRYRTSGQTTTRMFTCDPDGGNLHQVNPGGNLSHFVWRDSSSLLAWASVPGRRGAGFYFFKDQTGEVEPLGAGVMTENGHISCLPGARWILNDTYPSGPNRVQTLYLFDTKTKRRHNLGEFPMPSRYKGGLRCDLHPRLSPDGRTIVFDSTHGGHGRQMYLMDVSALVS